MVSDKEMVEELAQVTYVRYDCDMSMGRVTCVIGLEVSGSIEATDRWSRGRGRPA